MPTTFQPQLDPLGSVWLSAVVALLPLLTIFLTLGLLRWKAHKAGLTALLVAILVAVLAFKMPAGLALLAATQGAVFGLFPIVWIVFTAIALYQVTVVSGRFEDLRAVFNLISDDPRVQAMLIAFCFGGLLEALAGFGDGLEPRLTPFDLGGDVQVRLIGLGRVGGLGPLQQRVDLRVELRLTRELDERDLARGQPLAQRGQEAAAVTLQPVGKENHPDDLGGVTDALDELARRRLGVGPVAADEVPLGRRAIELAG